jgi:hypothetical protein
MTVRTDEFTLGDFTEEALIVSRTLAGVERLPATDVVEVHADGIKTAAAINAWFAFQTIQPTTYLPCPTKGSLFSLVYVCLIILLYTGPPLFWVGKMILALIRTDFFWVSCPPTTRPFSPLLLVPALFHSEPPALAKK